MERLFSSKRYQVSSQYHIISKAAQGQFVLYPWLWSSSQLSHYKLLLYLVIPAQMSLNGIQYRYLDCCQLLLAVYAFHDTVSPLTSTWSSVSLQWTVLRWCIRIQVLQYIVDWIVKRSFRKAHCLVLAWAIFPDRSYRCRHVVLPQEIAKRLPKNRLLSEAEWRGLGVCQSRGWVHYAIHR